MFSIATFCPEVVGGLSFGPRIMEISGQPAPFSLCWGRCPKNIWVLSWKRDSMTTFQHPERMLRQFLKLHLECCANSFGGIRKFQNATCSQNQQREQGRSQCTKETHPGAIIAALQSHRILTNQKDTGIILLWKKSKSPVENGAFSRYF